MAQQGWKPPADKPATKVEPENHEDGGVVEGEEPPEDAGGEVAAESGVDVEALFDRMNEIGTNLYAELQEVKLTLAAIHKGVTLVYQRQSKGAVAPPPAQGSQGGRPSGGGGWGGQKARQGSNRPQGRQSGPKGPPQGGWPGISRNTFKPDVLGETIDGGKWAGSTWSDVWSDPEGQSYCEYLVNQQLEKGYNDPYRWKYPSTKIALWLLHYGDEAMQGGPVERANTQPSKDEDVPF